MKVLLLPYNVASDISHKVRLLRSTGIDARGFSVESSNIQTTSDVKFYRIPLDGNRLTYRLKRSAVFARMWRWIAWADILHWIGDAGAFESELNRKFLLWLRKPGVVQFIGSDVRIPEVDFAINSFYKRAFSEGYEYKEESRERSLRNQTFFADLGFVPLEFVGMGHYISRELFPVRFRTWQSVVLSDHPPCYPQRDRRPLVVHSPSAPIAKGTKYVLQAVERLKTNYDFDFVLVQNTERRKALEIMRDCDIYVDQLIGGGHGYAAVEAMAFGKPVVGYINEEIGKDYPPELPILNANPDNFEVKLETLIADAPLRRRLGQQSRSYVEKYHDDQKNADELVTIYREVISLHRKRS